MDNKLEELIRSNAELERELAQKIHELELKNREIEIEAALERVRNRSMAMQRSDELKEVIQTISQQFAHLNISIEHAGFVIDYKPGGDWTFWVADKLGSPAKLTVADYDSVWGNSFKEAKEKESDFFATDLNFEEKNKFYRDLFSHTAGIAEHTKELIFSKPGLAVSTVLLENVSLYIENFSRIPYTNEENAILMRLGKAFEQTYTRFLDLQKAEAQIWEAQIEASLERVRSKTMAMHNSKDVGETVAAMFNELVNLGIGKNVRSGIGIIHDNVEMEVWTAYSEDDERVGLVIGRLDMTSHQMLQGVFNYWKNNTQHSSYTLTGDDQVAYYRAINNSADYEFKLDIEALPEKQFQNAFYFREGFIYVFSREQLTAGAIQIFKRFAGVFGLTYRRLLDLQKAEEQAKEAQIEVALERVRSRTMAMQKSDELAETAVVVFKQLIGLGIQPNRLFIGIIKDDSGDIELWATDEDGSRISTRFTGNKNRNNSVKKMYDGWKVRKRSVTIDMQGKELKAYFDYLGNELKVPFKLGLSQTRRVQTVAYFSQGFIGIASPGPQPAETTALLERFAGVFNLTYTRFNDLKIAEAHNLQAEQDLIKLHIEKKRAEEALKNLQAAQKQLIQSEKMASLGELTAGIAHEIQNPLNFVNNFSEVNQEMIDELVEELRSGNTEEALAIAADIKQNEEKIHHHGKRADGIVKGMLQHSRSGTGEKQLTNINTLADEFFKLSYHGLRAKDKTFNAELITHFDLSLPQVNISQQDIGRVLLNLFNNAFYAINQKSKTAGPDYKPTVTVTTFAPPSGGWGAMVKDNGNGIPDAIKDKIMQPFFTTKPTGEGTGLGLSLSYDIIVKGHGGSIDVETKEGKYTTFIIKLPSGDDFKA